MCDVTDDEWRERVEVITRSEHSMYMQYAEEFVRSIADNAFDMACEAGIDGAAYAVASPATAAAAAAPPASSAAPIDDMFSQIAEAVGRPSLAAYDFAAECEALAQLHETECAELMQHAIALATPVRIAVEAAERASAQRSELPQRKPLFDSPESATQPSTASPSADLHTESDAATSTSHNTSSGFSDVDHDAFEASANHSLESAASLPTPTMTPCKPSASAAAALTMVSDDLPVQQMTVGPTSVTADALFGNDAPVCKTPAAVVPASPIASMSAVPLSARAARESSLPPPGTPVGSVARALTPPSPVAATGVTEPTFTREQLDLAVLEATAPLKARIVDLDEAREALQAQLDREQKAAREMAELMQGYEQVVHDTNARLAAATSDLDERSKELAQAQLRLTQRDGELQRAHDDMRDLQMKVGELLSQNGELDAEYRALQANHAEAVKKFDELHERYTVTKNALTARKSNEQLLAETLTKCRAQLENAEAAVESLKTQSEAKLSALHSELRQSQKAGEQLRERVAELERSADAASAAHGARVAELEASGAALQAKLDAAQREAEASARALRNDLKRKQDELDEAQLQCSAVISERRLLESEVESLRAQVAQSAAELEQVGRERDAQRHEQQMLKAKIYDLGDDNRKLRDELAARKAEQAGGASVADLQRQLAERDHQLAELKEIADALMAQIEGR